MKKVLSFVLSLLIVISLAACGTQPAGTSSVQDVSSEETTDAGLWADATYTEDTEFGEGAKTVVVEVKAEENSVNFTLKTDAATLGEALLAHELIAGDESEYGLYIKTVNGILADYDVDASYWAFYKDGEYMMTGVDATEIADGEHYELIYTK